MSKNIKNVFVSNYTSDGVTDEYQIFGASTTDPGYHIVTAGKHIQTYNVDYIILPNFKIKFTTAPPINFAICIYTFSEIATNAVLGEGDNVTSITKTTYVTDGLKNTYPINSPVALPDNCIVTAGGGFARDGYIYQHGLDYNIINSNIVFTTTPPANFIVNILIFSTNQFKTIGGTTQRDEIAIATRHEIIADGIKDTYTVSGGTSNKSLNFIVASNRRLLSSPADYIVSHNRVKFKKKPAASTRLTFIVFGAAPSSIIPKPLTDRVRYLDKNNNLNERTLYRNYWREQISQYGVTVNYYTNLTNQSNADIIYGEAPLAGYSEPAEMNIIVRVDSESSLYSKFGYASDTESTCYIHHDDYQEVFGQNTEPKAGDLIEFTEIGIDRLNYPKRGPRIMEITEKNDEIPAEINNLAGHYVWQVKLKRFDYSREKTIIPELGTPEPTDTGETVPGIPNPIDELSKKIFDYEKSLCSNDHVYGDY